MWPSYRRASALNAEPRFGSWIDNSGEIVSLMQGIVNNPVAQDLARGNTDINELMTIFQRVIDQPNTYMNFLSSQSPLMIRSAQALRLSHEAKESSFADVRPLLLDFIQLQALQLDTCNIDSETAVVPNQELAVPVAGSVPPADSSGVQAADFPVDGRLVG